MLKNTVMYWSMHLALIIAITWNAFALSNDLHLGARSNLHSFSIQYSFKWCLFTTSLNIEKNKLDWLLHKTLYIK